MHLLDDKYLSINDVSLVPTLSMNRSRTDVDVPGFIFSAPMDTVTGYELALEMLTQNQFAVIPRFIDHEQLLKCFELAVHDNIFFAVGLDLLNPENMTDFIDLILDNHPCASLGHVNLAIDIAHGDMAAAHELTAELASLPFVHKIMSGSICTPQAATRAVAAGATHLRIGVGPGAACTTRLMTGVGVPNLSAVYNIWKAETGAFLIADGGIKEPGDAAKYLAAGANGIMLGSVLSKTVESPGWYPTDTGNLYKQYRGQASAAFQTEWFGQQNDCPEGAVCPPMQQDPNNTVQSIVRKFKGGLRSSASYLGLSSIADLGPRTVEMIQVTPSAYIEGTPHGNI